MTRGPVPSRLPMEWRFCAEATARNLGFLGTLKGLSPEQWQRVLTGVEMKMRFKGKALPTEWEVLLAKEVGRLND